MQDPVIIQGGMGAGVSNWALARAVSGAGQMGIVSGTGIEAIMAGRLRAGDEGAHVRRALAAFPDQRVADRIVATYFSGPRAAGERARFPKRHRVDDPIELVQETIAATFVEVFLAKQGHGRPVGINLLTKIQIPTLASLYGAMLADVDLVIMGAGIPREIPAVLDRLSRGEDVTMALAVEGAGSLDDFRAHLSPAHILAGARRELRRPAFFPIVASNVLATTMARKASGRIDGLVVEGPVAGGHNAPPRGATALGRGQEPVWGPRDEVDLARIADLGVPFYLAGGFGNAGRLRDALARGAAGIQVGTAFAFCRESGLVLSLKLAALRKAVEGIGRVVTDALASPTGFPFKVLNLEGTLSEVTEYLKRPRACNLGFLSHIYKREDGQIGYRCPAEPESAWCAKGGDPAETEGRKCLCNALLANVGVGRTLPDGNLEKPLLTVGACFNQLRELVQRWGENYSAANVLEFLLADAVPS